MEGPRCGLWLGRSVVATGHRSLDICYDSAPENTEKLAALLASWHAHPHGVDAGLPFFMDAKAFAVTPIMTLTTDVGPVDVMDRVAGVGEFSDVLANSVDVDVPGVRFRALTLRALVAAKRAVRRPRDLEQLPELEALLARTRRGSDR